MLDDSHKQADKKNCKSASIVSISSSHASIALNAYRVKYNENIKHSLCKHLSLYTEHKARPYSEEQHIKSDCLCSSFFV